MCGSLRGTAEKAAAGGCLIVKAWTVQGEVVVYSFPQRRSYGDEGLESLGRRFEGPVGAFEPILRVSFA